MKVGFTEIIDDSCVNKLTFSSLESVFEALSKNIQKKKLVESEKKPPDDLQKLVKFIEDVL